jgi:positive regulator of sigma E activity
MELSGLAADEQLAMGDGARNMLPVVITIRGCDIGSVLWYSLLLPLAGFILGAVVGQSILQSEMAAIIGAVIGLVLCSGITKSVPEDTLVIEPSGDLKISEIID